MSRFTFYLPDPNWLPQESRACILATDELEIPVPSKVEWEADRFIVSVLKPETRRIHVVIRTKRGSVLLSTVWLYPRWKPYRLELEILRGLLSRLRKGVEIWTSNDFPVPESLAAQLSELTHVLIVAWRQQDDPALAERLLEPVNRALELLGALADSLVKVQGCNPFSPPSVEPTNKAPSNSAFGVGLRLNGAALRFDACEDGFGSPANSNLPAASTGLLSHLLSSGHLNWISIADPQTNPSRIFPARSESASKANAPDRSALLPPEIHDIRTSGKRVILGPLFQIVEGCLPTGFQLGTDGQILAEKFNDWLRKQLPAVAQQVDMLHLVSGLNAVGVAGLTPTIQYQLVRSALETAASAAPNCPLMISFSQPMGERLAWSVGGQHPDQFLAKLAKERVPIHAIGLELDLGYFPTGTLPRDPFRWLQDLQQWSVWGVSIFVLLRVPSCEDLRGHRQVFAPGSPAKPSLESQRHGIVEFGKLLSAMPWIQGVLYNQWQDDAERFGDAGLITAEGQPKPILEQWLGLNKVG